MSETNTDPDINSLSLSSSRGIIASVICQLFRLIINLIVTMILARILSPHDFGTIAMALTVLNLGLTIKDVGIGVAIIQHESISIENLNTLFWINAGISTIIVIIFYIVAHPIAVLYNVTQLSSAIHILSLIILFDGLSVQHHALLARRMQFVRVSIIEMISILLSSITAIVASFKGYGWYSLAFKMTAERLLASIAYWIGTKWVPRPSSSLHKIVSYLNFSLYLTAYNILNYLWKTADKIIIGFFTGPETLGFYSKSYEILSYPSSVITNPVSRVFITTLSRLKAQPDKYIYYYQNAIWLMGFCGMPFIAFICIFPDVTVDFLLGPGWKQVANIIKVLSAGALLNTVNPATGLVYISYGTTKRQFKWQIIETFIQIIAILLTISHGIIAVGIAYSVTVVIMRIPAILFCYKNTDLKIKYFIKPVVFPAICSTTAALITKVIIINFIPAFNIFILLPLSFCIFTVIYITFTILIPSSRKMLAENAYLIYKSLFSGK